MAPERSRVDSVSARSLIDRTGGASAIEQFGDGLHVLLATDPDNHAELLEAALSRRGFAVHPKEDDF